MKELLNTKQPLFTEYENSIPSSRYLRLSMAGCDGNRAFPYIFPIQKGISKMDQITIFRSQKRF